MSVQVSWYQCPNRVSSVLVQSKSAQGTSIYPPKLAAHTSNALLLVLIAPGIILVAGFGSVLPTLAFGGGAFSVRRFLG